MFQAHPFAACFHCAEVADGDTAVSVWLQTAGDLQIFVAEKKNDWKSASIYARKNDPVTSKEARIADVQNVDARNNVDMFKVTDSSSLTASSNKIDNAITTITIIFFRRIL